MENQDSDLGKEKKVTKKPTISFVTCTAAAADVDEEGGREGGSWADFEPPLVFVPSSPT